MKGRSECCEWHVLEMFPRHFPFGLKFQRQRKFDHLCLCGIHDIWCSQLLTECRPNGVDQMAGTKFGDQMGKSADQLEKSADQMEKSAEQMEDLLTKWQACC